MKQVCWSRSVYESVCVCTVLWNTRLCPCPWLSMCVARFRQMARCRMASIVMASKKSCGRAGAREQTGVREEVRGQPGSQVNQGHMSEGSQSGVCV